MRLLSVSHFYASHGGGIERVAGHMCREFARLGHQALWAASSADPAPGESGVDSVPLDCVNPTEAMTGLPMPVPGMSGMRALYAQVKAADAIIIHDALYATSLLAMLFAKLHRRPVVLVQHIAAIPFASPILRWMMRLANSVVTRPMLRAADRVVFISDTVRAAFADVRTCAPPLLLFNGVDTAVFRRDGEVDTAAVRRDHCLPEQGRLMLFVGRLVAKKGLAVIAAAARARPDLHFVLVGDGPINPREWTLHNVHMLGKLSPARLARLYNTADALLLPSVGEGFPLVIQEAMACGLPVICGADTALADPGAAHWLRGVDVDLGDVAGSASRCVKALGAPLPDADARAAMADYAARHYSWPAMARAIIAALPTPAPDTPHG